MFYYAQYSLKQVSGFNKDWVLIIPLTVILSLFTYYLGYDPNRFIGFLASLYPQFGAILSIGLPACLFLVALAVREA